MKNEAAEYMSLLKLELQELYRQAEESVKDYTRRKEQWAVTEHVFYENVGLLQNKEHCLKRFIVILGEIDFGGDENVSALEERIRMLFRRHVDEAGCAPCTLSQAEARMEKVARLFHRGVESAP